MSKPVGHAMVVCSDATRSAPSEVLRRVGYEIDHRDDPYAAMLELCRRPLVFRAIVLSLQALYRDELQIIGTVRRRFPHITIWLTHTDGRQAALAEAMRLGAEGLVSEDGMHSFADSVEVPTPAPAPTQFRPAPVQASTPEPQPPATAPAARSANPPQSIDPVLTAEELQALLGDEV